MMSFMLEEVSKRMPSKLFNETLLHVIVLFDAEENVMPSSLFVCFFIAVNNPVTRFTKAGSERSPDCSTTDAKLFFHA